MKRILAALAALALVLVIPTSVSAVAPRCTPGVVAPHVEWIANDTVSVQAQATLVNCAKGTPPNPYHLVGTFDSQTVERSFACSTYFRPSCGTAIVFNTTFRCVDSDSPDSFTYTVTATGGVPEQTRTATTTFNCHEYGGAD